MTELALPAGSLQSALIAFSEGADAVYLGLKSFSARAGATNFSYEDLSKLREVAKNQNKKIYVTINTLIDETELNAAYAILKHVELIGCDGIIVQDLGLVHMIKAHTPSLKLHGSTQLAVHTIAGVQEMARLGFERVVLARELTFQEIKRIREACPDIQLKVFIHGALCYSFSGLCTASEQVCNRSANRGACAQICRNYFSVQADESVAPELSPLPKGAKTGWFFSMSDLKAGPIAKQLEDLGIESLKVEGRMKSPAYTSLATRYYRSVLDGSEDTTELDEALSVVFSRRQTSGWLGSYGREKQDFSVRTAPTLGSTSYPGHRGVKAGRVTLVKEDRVVLSLHTDIALRDGLMYFTKGKPQPIDTVKFGITHMMGMDGRSLTEAYKGETVVVGIPRTSSLPHTGEFLYVISRHDQTPALISEALPLSKQRLDMTFSIGKDNLTIQSSYASATYKIPTSKAQKSQDVLGNITSIFSQSDASSLILGEVTIKNNSPFALSDLFLPLSVLKSIRREWYELLDRILAQHLSEDMVRPPISKKLQAKELPPRSILQTENKIPYLDLSLLKKRKSIHTYLFAHEGVYYLPLSPVMFDEDKFFNDLEEVIKALEKEKVLNQVVFGLNNIGQVPFFRERQLPCFFDIYLYLANSEAAKLALSLGLALVGGYLWMERKTTETEYWPFLPTAVDDAFTPPLFISRSCFRHDSLLLSCEKCPHHGSWKVEANNETYTVLVEDCVTIVVRT